MLKIVRKKRPPNRPDRKLWQVYGECRPNGKIRYSRTCFTCLYRTGSNRSNVVCGRYERELWEFARCGHWELNISSAFLKRCDKFVDTKFLWRPINREFVDGYPSVVQRGKMIGGYYTNASNEITRDIIRVGRACANCEYAVKATGNMVECRKRKGRQMWSKACCEKFILTKDRQRLAVMERRIRLSGGDTSTPSWKYPVRGEVGTAIERSVDDIEQMMSEDFGITVAELAAEMEEARKKSEAEEARQNAEFVGPKHPFPEIWYSYPDYALADHYRTQQIVHPNVIEFELWMRENWWKACFDRFKRMPGNAERIAGLVTAEELSAELQKVMNDKASNSEDSILTRWRLQIERMPPDLRAEFENYCLKTRLHIELWLELGAEKLDEYIDARMTEESNKWTLIDYC